MTEKLEKHGFSAAAAKWIAGFWHSEKELGNTVESITRGSPDISLARLFTLLTNKKSKKGKSHSSADNDSGEIKKHGVTMSRPRKGRRSRY